MIVDREALIETLTKRLKDKNEQFKRRHDYRLVSRIDTTIPKTEDAASQVTANFAKKIQQANSTYYTTCNSTHTPYLTTITEHSPSKYHKRLWYSPNVRKKVISRAKKVFFDQVIFRSLTETKKVYKSIPIEERAIKHAFAVWDVDKHLNEQLHKYYHVTQHLEPIKHKPTPFQKNQTRTHLQRIIIKHKQTQNKSAHKNINFVLTSSSPVNLHHSTTYTSSSSCTSTGTNTQSATVNGVAVKNLLKLGTGSKVGDATLHVPAGTAKIGFYCVAWKGKKAQVKFSVGGTEITTINPAANVGATGNAPYTALNVADSDYYEVEVPAGATDIKVETLDASNGRVLFVGLKAF